MKYRRSTLMALSLLTLLPMASAGAALPLEPLVIGWQDVFTLQWQAQQDRGQTVLSGRIVNDSPYWVTHVQLLVEGLDGQGDVVSQAVTWLGSDLGPSAGSYFEVSAPESSSSYRVRVFAFDRIESPSEDRSR